MHTPRMLLLTALFAAASPLAFAEDVVGKWTGTVKAPNAEIPAVVTFTSTGGKLAASLESPSQAPGQQFPADAAASDGTKLTFESAALQGSYSGAWNAEKKAWVGVWTQGGVAMPLDLTRAQ